MKVPISWLKEYVAIDMTAEELADRLALTGTEVERVTRVGLPAADGNLDRFVIGRVKKKAAHPNADKLTLCEVEVGDGKVEQIVCGAKNFEEGDKTAVCLPGGTLPDGRKLEAAVIRGVESRGMMCSESELGLSSESAGIMILPEDAPVGDAPGRLHPRQRRGPGAGDHPQPSRLPVGLRHRPRGGRHHRRRAGA